MRIFGQQIILPADPAPGSSQAATARYAERQAVFVNVRNYGAAGDGVTDDTNAIRNAIAACPAGGVVWFPGGVYLVSSTIVLPAGRQYLGAGGLVGQTIIKGTSAVAGAVLAGYGWYNNVATSCDNPITIRGILVQGPGQGVSGIAGVALTSFWARVDDVYVTGVGSHGLLLTDVLRNGSVLTATGATCSENKINNCKIDAVGGDGVHAGNQANFNTNMDGVVWNTQISGCGGCGIFLDDAAGWLVDDNHVYTVGSHGILAAAGWCTRITGNYVESDFGTLAASGQQYFGIAIAQNNGWGSLIANNTVAVGQGNHQTAAAWWSGIDVESRGGATPSSPALVVVSGNQITYDPGAATVKAYGLSLATNGGSGAGRLQVLLDGNQVGPGFTAPQLNQDTTGCVTTDSPPLSRQIIAGTGLTGGGDLTADRTLAVAYGSTAGTAAQGNDTRLSDSRTPAGHAASHRVGGTDPLKAITSLGTIASGGTISITAVDRATYRATTSGNATFAIPTGGVDGMEITVELSASASGSLSITAGTTAPTMTLLSTGITSPIALTSGKRTFLGLRFVGGVGWFLIAATTQS